MAFGPLASLVTLALTLRSDKLNPWLQRDMLSPMVTLNPMVSVGTMLGSLYLMNM